MFHFECLYFVCMSLGLIIFDIYWFYSNGL